MMYSVLIVDDEPFVRLSIRNKVDWGRSGFEISGEAGNGQEAVRLMQARHFDLVVADMKMPEMDGIGLVKEVNRLCLDIIIVIISGYTDYNYLRESLIHNAFDYLLKPVGQAELLSLLERVKERLAASRENNHWLSLRKVDCKNTGHIEDNYFEKEKSGKEIVPAAQEYIERFYENDLTLNSVAQQFFINPNYFSMLFQQETGISFTHYLNEVRISSAKKLLTDTTLNLSEIAAMVGYGDHSYFTKVFKKLAGTSPSIYRSINPKTEKSHSNR